MNKSLLLAAAISVALLAGATSAAEIVPINFDDPGEGYNDATPAAPVGGNPGTTVGEQRQIVAQFVADLWGGVLVSDVPVYVGAEFNPLDPGVLGSAGASFIFRNFTNAAVPDTWYSATLAEARTGIIVGANVQATSNLCLASSAGKGAYKRCMEVYKRKRLCTVASDRRPCGAGFFG